MKQTHVRHRTVRFIRDYLSSLDCARGLTTWLLFINNEHRQLVDLECDPQDHNSIETFRRAYSATKFLSKADFLSLDLDLKAVALEKFEESEKACRLTNRRVALRQNETLEHASLIFSARRKISNILGQFIGDEMFDSANWGPGVTTLIKGSDTSPVNKFRSETGTTQLLHDSFGDLFAIAYPTWTIGNRSIMSGNEVITVPKNSKTDRTIAIEPGLNLWLQKGVGTMIRRRLLRSGINLNDQRHNQRLARVGSKFDNLATIDFSAASDTISLETVRELLPPDWFLVLSILRSHQGLINNSLTQYEKFSSMGNGFTFELESLIFYALAVACVSSPLDTHEVSVYGDDVIIPVDAVDRYTSLCAYLGFVVNKQKSFSSGYFRESCGEHYWNGISCKPYFLKEVLRNDEAIRKAYNSVIRLNTHAIGNFRYRDSSIKRTVSNLIRLVPPKRRFMISDGYGDGGFIGNYDESNPVHAKYGYEGSFTKHVVSVPCGYASEDHALLLARLRNRSVDKSLSQEVYYRGRVKHVVKRLYVRQWCNLGPWL